MKLHTPLMLALMTTLFAVSPVMATGQSPNKAAIDCPGMGMMSGGMGMGMGMDPEARAKLHLAELSAALKLSPDQQAAWKTFSEQVSEQARSMASMRDAMMGKDSALSKPAPEAIEKMAEMMQERARLMARMAGLVKTFYDTLTPEQQAAFDTVHASHMGTMGRKGPGMMTK